METKPLEPHEVMHEAECDDEECVLCFDLRDIEEEREDYDAHQERLAAHGDWLHDWHKDEGSRHE